MRPWKRPARYCSSFVRVLALDIGGTRIGFAISDPTEAVATPLCVLSADDVINQCAPFRRLLEDWEPEHLLFGMPYSLNGAKGPQAKTVEDVAKRIASACKLPYSFADERLSSQEAKRSLREKGMGEREMRGKVDMIAACLFLQSWLDERARQKALEADEV